MTYLHQRAMRVDRLTVTQELTQVPFVLRAIHPLAPPGEVTLQMVIGPGDAIGPLHLGFGMEFNFSTKPYEGPGK